MQANTRRNPANASRRRSSALRESWPQIFAGALGALLGLALLKFGNPVILDRLIQPPANIWEYLFQPWPLKWAYGLIVAVILLSLPVIRLSTTVPRWIAFLPLIWLGWQCLAGIKTIDKELTAVTLLHFAACVVFFYLGLYGLSRVRRTGLFWAGLLVGFAIVLWTGFEQHYGGLEETRRFIYSQPDWRQYPPEYLKKIASNRIFSTLVYPNALAGGVLLLLPPLLAVIWNMANRLTQISRMVVVGVVAYGGLACLLWSGSKSGWLIASLMAVVVVGQRPIRRSVRIAVAVTVLLLSLAGFAIKFTPYFQKGATSVSARFDYWTAAWKIFTAHPVFGTGPGTFSVSYRDVKPPDAEMARLTHNDYLEQASDSGLIGFLSYFAFIFGILAFLFRRRRPGDSLVFATWLGLLGWALQGFVEFPLYIPALAWLAFAFLGSLVGFEVNRIEIDRNPGAG